MRPMIRSIGMGARSSDIGAILSNNSSIRARGGIHGSFELGQQDVFLRADQRGASGTQFALRWGVANRGAAVALLIWASATLIGCGVMRSGVGKSRTPSQSHRAHIETSRANTHAANPADPARPFKAGENQAPDAAGPAGRAPVQKGSETGLLGTSKDPQKPTGTRSAWTVTTITQTPAQVPPGLPGRPAQANAPNSAGTNSVQIPQRRRMWGPIVTMVTLSLVGLGALAWVRSRRRLPS